MLIKRSKYENICPEQNRYIFLEIYNTKSYRSRDLVCLSDLNPSGNHETNVEVSSWDRRPVTIPVPVSVGRGRCCERSVLTIIYHRQQIVRIVTTHCANWININTWYFRCQLSIAPGPGQVSGQHASTNTLQHVITSSQLSSHSIL